MRRSERRASDAPVDPRVSIAAMGLAMVPWSVGARMAVAWMNGAARMNAEWARLIADRVHEDAETRHEMLTRGSPVRARALQTKFPRVAVSDHAAEAARIAADAAPPRA